MKKTTAVLAILLLCFSLKAQPDKSLSFVYIAHDGNTSTVKLIDRLKEMYDDARNNPQGNAVIFYLPNGNYPITVRMNTGKDNPEDFANIVEDIQKKRSHDVEKDVDLKKIQEIFNETDIVDRYGHLKYSSVTWTYYVNSTFWELGNNENIIAALYWIMDMERYIKEGYLTVDMFYCEDTDVLPFDETLPFGNKALCRSVNLIPLPY